MLIGSPRTGFVCFNAIAAKSGVTRRSGMGFTLVPIHVGSTWLIRIWRARFQEVHMACLERNARSVHGRGRGMWVYPDGCCAPGLWQKWFAPGWALFPRAEPRILPDAPIVLRSVVGTLLAGIAGWVLCSAVDSHGLRAFSLLSYSAGVGTPMMRSVPWSGVGFVIGYGLGARA